MRDAKIPTVASAGNGGIAAGVYAIEGGDLYLLLGGNFADGRGNAVIAASAYDRDDVLQSEREWSAIDLQGNGSATGIAGQVQGGSAPARRRRTASP